jgi:uncharacterized membrane protein
MAKIYYVGDWAILTGPVFAESPFQHSPKGLEIFNYGVWLKNALESTGEHQVESVSSWDFYKLPPGKYEEIIEKNDILIFSDFEAKLFQLSPDFFIREKFGEKVLVFPDRLKLTVNAVKEKGKGLMLLGGWYSFTGELGKGGWGRTFLKDIMPVKCLDHEDLVESTEGYYPVFTEKGAEIFSSIDFESMPPILGYNQTLEIEEGEVLAYASGSKDPLLAVRKAGKGKVLAYTSDPAPHWALNFVYWKHYNDFWIKCAEILTN